MTLRKPHLPEAATLAAICDEIERGSGIGGWGMETADFCRFLMFTGCRKSEAAAGCWTDVDLARGIIRIAGTKTEAATREVPLIPPAKAGKIAWEDYRQHDLVFSMLVEMEAPPGKEEKVKGLSELGKGVAKTIATLAAQHELKEETVAARWSAVAAFISAIVAIVALLRSAQPGELGAAVAVKLDERFFAIRLGHLLA